MIRVRVEGEPVRAAVRSATVIPGSTSQLINDSHFVSDAAYVHTDANYTAAEKTKLSGIEAGAEVNAVEAVKVNGTTLTPDQDRAVDVPVPVKTSDLTNDSVFVSLSEATFAAKMDTVNGLLKEIAFGNGNVQFTNFKDLQKLVRLGLARKVLSVGDQVSCQRACTVSAAVSNSESNSGVSAAAVDRDAFLQAMGVSRGGNYTFYWDGSAWRFAGKTVTLAAYGITVTGTPAVGDRIVVSETADTLVWDVIGIDCDTPANGQYAHSVTLGLHECIAQMQFDGREALFYCQEGLAAGTYHFTVMEHPEVSDDEGTTLQFTLTQAVPVGGQVVLQGASNATLKGSTVKTYASALVDTAMETATLAEGSAGESLGCVGNSADGNTNALPRALYGSNNYAQSAVRQYLNSNAAAGSVWTPQNVWDRAPSWEGSTAGFLNGMDAEFLSAIGEVTKKTALCGGSTNTTEKFFLLSRSEVYGGEEITGGEGAAYPYYADNSDLAQAGTGDDAGRIKRKSDLIKNWWLRSPYAHDTHHMRYVGTTGGIYNLTADYSAGWVVPACCIV